MGLSVSLLFKSWLFSESSLGYLGEVTKVCVAAACSFLGDLDIFEANIYTSYPPGLEIAVWVQVHTMSASLYNVSMHIPWVQVCCMSQSLFHESKSIQQVQAYILRQRVPKAPRLAKGIKSSKDGKGYRNTNTLTSQRLYIPNW